LEAGTKPDRREKIRQKHFVGRRGGELRAWNRGPKYFAYFFAILCINSRHAGTGQSNSKQLAGFGRKEVRLKSTSAGKTGQIEVLRMNFGC
jgi:hypothetical protein